MPRVVMIRRTLGQLLLRQDGQAILEYGLIIVIIAVSLVSLVAAIGNPIIQALERATTHAPVRWSPQ